MCAFEYHSTVVLKGLRDLNTLVKATKLTSTKRHLKVFIRFAPNRFVYFSTCAGAGRDTDGLEADVRLQREAHGEHRRRREHRR